MMLSNPASDKDSRSSANFWILMISENIYKERRDYYDITYTKGR